MPGAISLRLVPLAVLVIKDLSWFVEGVTPRLCNDRPGRYTTSERTVMVLVALASGVRAAVKNGKVSMVVPAPFVEAMKQAGLRLREYRLDPGGSVNCTISADDDAVVSRLRAPLAGVKRVDLVRIRGGLE